MNGNFVAYFRVSTDHQGLDGNGIAAQRKAVADYMNGGRWNLVAEFTEVESGKRSDRPQLAAALDTCKRHRAKLVIAKLDRLSRNVHFISGLMERKVDFVACDMPSANAFMINIYAAVAQEERRMISDRTKAGLAAAKARGVVLGNQAQADANKAAAAARDVAIRPILVELAGKPLRTIAQALTERAISAPRGGAWNQVSVMRAMKRLGLAGPA
jgi:DNA invertase Pin-like site-specific DNA recombinase